MTFQNCLIDAIDIVLRQDIEDEFFGEAVTVQASLMARINPEEIQALCSD